MLIKSLGLQPYRTVLESMRRFTQERAADTDDEIWLVEHPPVYTLGLAGKIEHVLDAGVTPVEQTERGGQVTYHGPGQCVAYTLLDLRRLGLQVRGLVCRLEQAVIDLLAEHQLDAERKAGAPGVYLSAGHLRGGAKIAALGLKISRGYSFHGLALNVSMDLKPFSGINPCGEVGLAVTDLQQCLRLSDHITTQTQSDFFDQTAQRLAQHLVRNITGPVPAACRNQS
jgi:lipoyl(octanoyl) transferase